MITDELKVSEKERDCLVRCVSDAYDSLKLVPGIDVNGPVLVWLAEHLLHLHRRATSASASAR
ncbi:MAG TPA: hypothetical protein VGP25_01540 [Gemmatimonadaceae bacterium]|jgi:hypothetical protein|nr:hypothetical protein [Gemmatimonadaceae bacterium]